MQPQFNQNSERNSDNQQSPETAISYRFGVQLYLLRQSGQDIEIYLQQRHSDLRSFPDLWTCVGGVIDGLQNLTETELSDVCDKISTFFISTSLDDMSGFVDSLIDEYFLERKMRYFCEKQNKPINADHQKKREILSNMLVGIERELKLENFNSSSLNSSLVFRLIAISTAKIELLEEAGVDTRHIGSERLIFNRVTESNSGSSNYRFPIFFLKADDLPDPRFNHDEEARSQSGLPPRLEAQNDGWFSLNEAIEMQELITPQSFKTVQLLVRIQSESDLSNVDELLSYAADRSTYE